MREGIKVLKLDKYEINTILNALKFYKELADEADKDSILICRTILKIIDTPEKTNVFRKNDRDEVR